MALPTVEVPRTEVRAEARFVRTAPRKAQLVAEQIRGRTVPEARTILAFMTRDAARDVERVLSSAVANAEANHGLVGDDLLVTAAYAGAGPTIKRWRARARGRVARIKKRTCHITVRVGLPGEETIPEPRGSVVLEPEPAEEAPKPKRAAKPKAEPKTDEPKTEPAPDEPTAEEKPEVKPKPKRTTRKKTEPKAEAAKAKPASEKKSGEPAKPARPRRKKEES